MLEPDACYAALRTRDRRFDGRFFVAVHSTGVYCRPVCPSRTPRRDGVTFFRSAAEAHQAGYRACLRCRPESAPRSAAWLGTEATVRRAVRLIEDGALNTSTVPELAARLGISDRRLRALFHRHLGTSPRAVAHSHRLRAARLLLTSTSLPMSDVADAAGFRSLRSFNDAVLRGFGRSPTALRRSKTSAPTLRTALPYRPPMDFPGIMAYLSARAIPGVEQVDDTSWRHGLDAEGHTVRVSHAPERNVLEVEIPAAVACLLPSIVGRVRRAFDLDADPDAVADHLRPLTVPVGLRLPGAFDPFAVAVRIVLGQQVSVKGATTLAGRLSARLGLPQQPLCAFPGPEALLATPLDELGMPRMRIRALTGLARAVLDRSVVLDGTAAHPDVVAALVAVPGIGPWTAQMIALRACGDPDAFPETDLVLGRMLDRLPPHTADRWRPWRAYAAMALWRAASESP